LQSPRWRGSLSLTLAMPADHGATHTPFILIDLLFVIDLISYMHLILCYIYNVRCNNQMPDGSRLLYDEDYGSKLSAKLAYWLSR
jgi:hypothetical protein